MTFSFLFNHQGLLFGQFQYDFVLRGNCYTSKKLIGGTPENWSCEPQFLVRPNLSLATKWFGKPLRNGHCGLQFWRVCQNLCLKSRILEEPLRTGHLDNNSLGLVTISPLQLKDFRSFQEMAKQGNNSSKFVAIFPLNLKYLRNPKELLIFKNWATNLWALSR